MKVVEMTWGFQASNPLDFLAGDIDFELATHDGLPVQITKPMVKLRVTIDGEIALETDNNVNVCYLLNTRQVGWVND